MLQGLQSLRAGLASAFGKWRPGQPLFDRVYSVDLSTIPLTSALMVPIVNGVEDFVIIVNGLAIMPLSDPSGLVQTEFPLLVGNVIDQNGSITQVPVILPHQVIGPGVMTPAGGTIPWEGRVVLAGPVVLAPGAGLNIYGVGVAQLAGEYQIVVSFTQQKLTPAVCTSS